jgi:hypothetical protein
MKGSTDILEELVASAIRVEDRCKDNCEGHKIPISWHYHMCLEELRAINFSTACCPTIIM